MPKIIGDEPTITIRASDPIAMHILGALYIFYNFAGNTEKLKELEEKEKAFLEYRDGTKEQPKYVD